MNQIICPHTVNDIPDLCGGYLTPKDCVLIHNEEMTTQEWRLRR